MPRSATRVVTAAVLVALCAGCGRPAPTSPTPAGPASAATASAAATAAAPAPTTTPGPSPQAQLVCEDEAQEDIALQLGVHATTVGPPTYAAGVSTCRYAYPQGGFTLSVHDLPDEAATGRAYDAVGATMGHVQDMDLQDARAYTTTNGSIVMQTQVLGLSYADAAQVCDCPTGTIRSRVARARDDLVVRLAESPPVPDGRARRAGGATRPPA